MSRLHGRTLYVATAIVFVASLVLFTISGISRFKNGNGIDGVIGGIGWFGGLLLFLVFLVLGVTGIVRAWRRRAATA